MGRHERYIMKARLEPKNETKKSTLKTVSIKIDKVASNNWKKQMSAIRSQM